MLPQNGYIKLTNEDDIKNMSKMLEMFDDNEDVQNVWHNWEDAGKHLRCRNEYKNLLLY